jgi:UDP-glucose 4-epimerase
MNVLVVGGAGYIGSHAVRRLLAAGHQVLVYDNLSQGHRQAVPAETLIIGDLLNEKQLTETLRDRKVDAVMHFAAFTLVGESVCDPEKYYHNNVQGSLALLRGMRQSGVNKIVFSSTTATYGVPKTVPISEEEVQRPINPYGFGKLVVEQALADYAAAYGIGYAALRYFNAAGANEGGMIGEDHSPESHLIPLVLQVALGQRSKIMIFGHDYPTPDGTCVRDYIHVDDLADAHLRALERLEPGKGLKLNLGSGQGISVRELIEACRRETRHSIPEELGARRAGDPPELVANSSLARRILDWEPQRSDLQNIVRSAWRWHSAHPCGYAAR